MRCPGSVALIASLPLGGKLESATDPTFEGTCAHAIAADCLDLQLPASVYIGHEFSAPDGTILVADEDMCVEVQKYVDYVEGRLKDLRDMHGHEAVTLRVEEAIDISGLTGTPGDTGTADAVLIAPRFVEVIDLKFGRGVKVFAADNWQLRMYGISVVRELELVQDIDALITTIHQPRLGHGDSYIYGRPELQELEDELKNGALLANLSDAVRVPGDEQCKFCDAKAICPEKREWVVEMVWQQSAPATAADFEDMTIVSPDPVAELDNVDDDWLAKCMDNVDMIERWCKAVRAEVERRLLAGEPVEGWKLVEGKRGNRKWSSSDEAEKLLKGFKLKTADMYDMKVISPTSAEKLHKAGKIGPRQWPKVQDLITQAEGTPSVAPISDPRPAAAVLKADSGDFDDVSTKE